MRSRPARLALVVLASAAAGAWIGEEIRTAREEAEHDEYQRRVERSYEDLRNEPDEVLPDDVLLTMTEGHYDAGQDYELTLRKDGDVLIERFARSSVRLRLSSEQMHEVVRTCLYGGLGSMRRAYPGPGPLDCGSYALTLNALSLKKSLYAYGGDPEAGPALELFKKLRALIGVDAHIGWNAGPPDPPDSRPADGK